MVHAVAVLAGICAASVLCSAILALWVYALRRQIKKAAQHYKTGMDTLLGRVQALDDRIAIVALTAAQRPASPQPAENNPESSMIAFVSGQGDRPEDEGLRTIRKKIERLTTQFAETDDPEGQDLSSTSQNEEEANQVFSPAGTERS